MEDKYPGLWQSWFTQQTVAIGWPPPWWALEGKTDTIAWAIARKAAKQIRPGDKILVQLNDSRVGRVGTVVASHILDNEWAPTVPKDRENPEGEMGRRFDVRWDLNSGPISPSAVAKLPEKIRFQGATLRLTVARVPDELAAKIEEALRDEAIWTTIQSRFATERAISEYINEFPHTLEAGLRPYPNAKTREFTFKDKKRSDVLLLDPSDGLVIVECKQHAPSLKDLEQLRGYMKRAKTEIIQSNPKAKIRGILVHGGSRRIDSSVSLAARQTPMVEIVRFEVKVDFVSSQ